MKNETEVERSTDKIPLPGNRLPGTIKLDDKTIARFIELLQKEKVIDAECNTAYSDKEFEKYIRKMASKLADPKAEIKKECEYCGQPFTFISRKRKYCPGDSCKTMACRARKKKGNSKDII